MGVLREIQAAIDRKLKVDGFFQIPTYVLDTADLLAHVHGWPFVAQVDTRCVFHDDVFAAYKIGSVIAPVQYLRYWDTSSSLH